jgi:hypothetical protein
MNKQLRITAMEYNLNMESKNIENLISGMTINPDDYKL